MSSRPRGGNGPSRYHSSSSNNPSNSKNSSSNGSKNTSYSSSSKHYSSDSHSRSSSKTSENRSSYDSKNTSRGSNSSADSKNVDSKNNSATDSKNSTATDSKNISTTDSKNSSATDMKNSSATDSKHGLGHDSKNSSFVDFKNPSVDESKTIATAAIFRPKHARDSWFSNVRLDSQSSGNTDDESQTHQSQIRQSQTKQGHSRRESESLIEPVPMDIDPPTLNVEEYSRRAKKYYRSYQNPEKLEKKKYAELKDHFKKYSKTREYGGHDYKVHSVGWSCDGRRLASGSCDKTVCLFVLDAYKLKLDHIFRGHTDSVDQLRWHPKHPDLLGTASGDKSVKIWDAREEKVVESFSTIGENINIAWSPDGQEIAVGNKDDLITFFDVRTTKSLREEPYKFEVNEICWSPEADLFFLTNGDGCIYIHDYPSMTIKNIIKAHPSNCICIEFRRDGKYFAVGAADAVVSLWDYKEMCCIRTFSHLDWPVRTLSFNYDGTLIVSGSEDMSIDISQVSTGEQVIDLTVESPTFTVAWHPTKNLLAYAGDDKNKYDNRDKGTIKLFGLPNE